MRTNVGMSDASSRSESITVGVISTHGIGKIKE